jgi:predicted alpha/beta hydrolase family esterase
VVQDDWLWPKRGDWMARLEEVVIGSEQRAVLVAHSLGCLLVAAWAAHSQNTARVACALLVAPPDVEREDMPPNLYSWRPITRKPLPFPALAVLSDDDPFCTPQRARRLVGEWECQLVSIGDAGHINGASNLGEWPDGQVLLRGLVASAP